MSPSPCHVLMLSLCVQVVVVGHHRCCHMFGSSSQRAQNIPLTWPKRTETVQKQGQWFRIIIHVFFFGTGMFFSFFFFFVLLIFLLLHFWGVGALFFAYSVVFTMFCFGTLFLQFVFCSVFCCCRRSLRFCIVVFVHDLLFCILCIFLGAFLVGFCFCMCCCIILHVVLVHVFCFTLGAFVSGQLDVSFYIFCFFFFLCLHVFENGFCKLFLGGEEWMRFCFACFVFEMLLLQFVCF